MSSKELSISNTASSLTGRVGIAAIVFLYTALYTLNYWLPIDYWNYTSRIWNWSQIALTLGACLTLIMHWRLVTTRTVLLGFALALLSTLAHWLRHPGLLQSVQNGVAVWVCFLAGAILFKDQETISVPAFRPPLANIGKSVLFGILFAIPLAVINNLYFYLNAGAVQWQNVFSSAFEGLSPAIHEEIVFRFFVIAFCLRLLKSNASLRWTTAVAVFLAVVPHSLNHLPDLFLVNPMMGLSMFAATSLLFGLPMALLQIRKGLESAIAFHWFIDFARFFFGF